MSMAGAFTAAGAERPEPGIHPITFTATWDGSEQPYYLFVPSTPTSEPIPMVVVLHGKGANWRSWFEATQVTQWAEREGMIVISPHGRGDWFYTGPGERDVLDAVAHAKSLLPVDEDRVYLIGHSMGGWGTWHLGISHPNIFAAIAPMATWPPVARLAGARHLAPYIVHGDADPIIPPNGSRLAVQHLERLDILHEYIEFPGRGHESAMINEAFEGLGEWLRQWRRVGDAPFVQLRSHTPRRGANQWLQLARVHRWTDLATIDAEIRDGALSILTGNTLEFFAAPPVGDGTLSIRIDGQQLVVDGYTRGNALHFLRETVTWAVEIVAPTAVKPAAPRILHQLDEVERDLPVFLAEIVADAFPEASVVLMPRDLVAPRLWAGDFTEDHLLDLFLHEEDHLYLYRMTAGEARELLAAQPQWFPPWWIGLETWQGRLSVEDDAPAMIVAPEVLGKRLPAFGRPAGVSLRRTIYDVLRQRGTFDR